MIRSEDTKIVGLPKKNSLDPLLYLYVYCYIFRRNCSLQVFSFYGYNRITTYKTFGIEVEVGPQECFKVHLTLIGRGSWMLLECGGG